MADTPFPHEPGATRAGPALSEAFEHLLRFGALPPGDDGEPVLDHEEMRATLADVRSSRDAIAMLARLLALAGPEAMAGPEDAAGGLQALLDGVRTRLDLAVDSLQGLSYQLMHPAAAEAH